MTSGEIINVQDKLLEVAAQFDPDEKQSACLLSLFEVLAASLTRLESEANLQRLAILSMMDRQKRAQLALDEICFRLANLQEHSAGETKTGNDTTSLRSSTCGSTANGGHLFPNEKKAAEMRKETNAAKTTGITANDDNAGIPNG